MKVRAGPTSDDCFSVVRLRTRMSQMDRPLPPAYRPRTAGMLRIAVVRRLITCHAAWPQIPRTLAGHDQSVAIVCFRLPSQGL